MEASEIIACPFCGQSFSVLIDTSVAHQTLVVDCEICCRPMELAVECEPGEVSSVAVHEA